MNVRSISIHDYSYDLPDERIAKYPLAERSSSRLLVYRSGEIGDSHFVNLPSELPEGAVLVRNNSRVIHARLLFQRPTGAQVEVFCLSQPSLVATSSRCKATGAVCGIVCSVMPSVGAWGQSP